MNLDALLKQAMEPEKAQAPLYKGLEKKFYFFKEISQFWADMAEDEKGHYENIVKMHSQLKLGQLFVEVSDDLYNMV
ncbi:MAG: ferritin family protein, partial [Candidatus Omnitrophota bacterium]|nr:ferritin family protein [Candidatus Omnitrophota bacterium]